MIAAIFTVYALAAVAGFIFGIAAVVVFNMYRRERQPEPKKPSARVLNLQQEREERGERWVLQQEALMLGRRR